MEDLTTGVLLCLRNTANAKDDAASPSSAKDMDIMACLSVHWTYVTGSLMQAVKWTVFVTISDK